MVAKTCPDDEFLRLFNEFGPHKTARILKIGVRRVYSRRANWEEKTGFPLKGPPDFRNTRLEETHPARATFSIKNGVVLVASDAHYWPGPPSAAHLAFIKLIRDLQPEAVVMNGDVMDFASISRHPPIGWENRPTVIQELEAAQERMQEIELAAPKKVRLFWPLGNHDSRMATKLATNVPEFARVKGVHLKDHFSNRWEPCWSTWINNSVVIKHRYKGGINATHNNTLWAGKTVITGHLHSLKVTPFDDYNGIRYGVDTGCLADCSGKQFLDYTEDNPKNWRSGFVVLTFRDGRLMWPEVVHVDRDGRVEFRGGYVEVNTRGHEKISTPTKRKRG